MPAGTELALEIERVEVPVLFAVNETLDGLRVAEIPLGGAEVESDIVPTRLLVLVNVIEVELDPGTPATSVTGLGNACIAKSGGATVTKIA